MDRVIFFTRTSLFFVYFFGVALLLSLLYLEEAKNDFNTKVTLKSAFLYIEDNSNLRWNNTFPNVEYKSKEELAEMFYQKTYEELVETYGREQLNVKALYADYNDTIYFPKRFDVTSKENFYIVLHEAVHYLQDLNEVPYECKMKLEPQAYKIQMKWMDENRMDSELYPDSFFLHIIEHAPCQGFW